MARQLVLGAQVRRLDQELVAVWPAHVEPLIDGDEQAGLFQGEGRYSDVNDPARVGLPVTLEGGFRATYGGSVPNPN